MGQNVKNLGIWVTFMCHTLTSKPKCKLFNLVQGLVKSEKHGVKILRVKKVVFLFPCFVSLNRQCVEEILAQNDKILRCHKRKERGKNIPHKRLVSSRLDQLRSKKLNTD